MNLILGLSIPLANEKKSFLKVFQRLLQKGLFRTLSGLSVEKLFSLSAFCIQKTRIIIAFHYLVYRSSLVIIGKTVRKVFTYKHRDGIRQKCPPEILSLLGIVPIALMVPFWNS